MQKTVSSQCSVVSIKEMLSMIKKDSCYELIKECIDSVPSKRPEFKEVKRKFITIMKKAKKFSLINTVSTKHSADELLSSGEEFLNTGEHVAAIWCFNECLQSRSYQNERAVHTKLGEAYEKAGNYKKALKCYNDAKACIGESNGNCELDKINVNLLSVCIKLKDIKLAKVYANKAKSIYENVEYSMDKIELLNSQSSLCLCSSQYEEAIIFSEEVLKIITTHGNIKRSIDAAIAYNNLASAYRFKKLYFESIDCLEKAMEILNANSDPEAGDTFAIFGQVYSDMQDSDRAIESYERARNIYSKVYEESHPSLEAVYDSLGTLYARAGKNRKAIECYKRNAGTCGKGYTSKRMGQLYVTLAVLYARIKNYKVSAKYYKGAARIYGDKNALRLAYLLNNQGVMQYKHGKYDGIVELFRESIDKLKLQDIEEILAVCHNVEAACKKTKQLRIAVQIYEEVLEKYKGHEEITHAVESELQELKRHVFIY